MAQTIRRNAKPARRQARAQGTRTKVRKAQAKTNSLIDALMRVLPFTEEQLHKAFLVLILGGAAALAWFVASLAGLTALAGQQLALRRRRRRLRGQPGRGPRGRADERAQGLRARARRAATGRCRWSISHALRASLMELSWVEDARVSRQLPDTIVVDIVERKPHAVLQQARPAGADRSDRPRARAGLARPTPRACC